MSIYHVYHFQMAVVFFFFFFYLGEFLSLVFLSIKSVVPFQENLCENSRIMGERLRDGLNACDVRIRGGGNIRSHIFFYDSKVC